MMEILTFVAGMVCGFKVKGIDKVPERAFQKLGTAVRKPARDVNVNVNRREGWEGVQWLFESKGGQRSAEFEKLIGADGVDE